MSFPLSPRARSGPRRRSLLAAAPAALLVTGCSAGSGDPGGPAAARPSAAERTRARAARDSRALAARYDAVAAAHPKLAERLRPLRADVVRHAEAFEAGADGSASPAPSVSGSSASPAPATPSAGATAAAAPSSAPSAPAAPAVPANEKDALAELAAAEREIADRRAEELVTAPAELARLLASVSASGAAHVYLLTEARR
ncbi:MULTISPECIES: hypothetical protein [Actinomycetes]|uniref:hypothetical protein n=1 Tax=Actinomycetes TaxID=1760 RepID=UPI000524562D|nr:hypothetical protein [Actinospica acidiphila]MBM4828285.1 hypothetical protein [Actinospica acidiphila]MCC9688545.1 hypothetical protein [Streptomyces sp. MNU103]GGQ83100.1 hypothetical protein GCM10010250_63080 [Streptomyces althioticus]